ncbi:MAG: hypothetical protein K0B05_04180, partial [Bacteroidales bacterium]|nr:hypothetical protein [Bacteroidales bacterium]
MNEKRLLVVFLVTLRFFSLFSQEGNQLFDTLAVRRDTLPSDTTVRSIKTISANSIDKQVTYNAEGYKKTDMVNRTTTLIDKAYVIYGDLEIRADSIVFNMETNIVFAAGLTDSTGRKTGRPVFK